jgi:3-isopropylmalate/(R)-2-methylmalate dehydratase small subunit
MDYGFKVVISSRFADIFRGNSGKQGLLTALVDQDVVDQLWKEIENHPDTKVTVDLESRTITAGGLSAKFEVDEYVRWRLMEGLDDVGLTLKHVETIGEFEGKRAAYKPTTA